MLLGNYILCFCLFKEYHCEFTTSKLVKQKPLGECSKLKMKTQWEVYGIYNYKNLITEHTFGDSYKSDTASVNTYSTINKWLLKSKTSKWHYHILPDCSILLQWEGPVQWGRGFCSLWQEGNMRSQKEIYLQLLTKSLAQAHWRW